MSASHALTHWLNDAQLSPLGAGHIHDTYLVHHSTGQFVLQRVNQAVFSDPLQLMAQAARVLQQWRKQNLYRVPELLPPLDRPSENVFGVSVDGEYWRLWRYLEGTEVVDPIENQQQIKAVGAAFAYFQAYMADLPGAPHVDTIKGFLQLNHYLQEFAAVASAAPARLRQLVDRHAHLAQGLGERNAYIHGDCKINNVLFKADRQEVAAVIDFDTVMYGHWAWDFGDLVRSVCFSKADVRVQDFAAALQGFATLQRRANVRDSVAAPAYVTLMLAVRFLNDHLRGDEYFKVAQRGDNLVRAEQQFRLLQQFVQRADELEQAAELVFAQVAQRD